MKRLEDGKFQLSFEGCSMSDIGLIEAVTPSNRPGEHVKCSCQLDVVKGEEAPVLGSCDQVTGVANKHCSFALDYLVGCVYF